MTLYIVMLSIFSLLTITFTTIWLIEKYYLKKTKIKYHKNIFKYIYNNYSYLLSISFLLITLLTLAFFLKKYIL